MLYAGGDEVAVAVVVRVTKLKNKLSLMDHQLFHCTLHVQGGVVLRTTSTKPSPAC